MSKTTIFRYSDFINESKRKNIEFSEEMSLLENEYLRMKSGGLSENQINENIFGSLFTSLGSGFIDTFKNYIIDWAVEQLGIEPFDEERNPSFFYQVLRNVIESISWIQLGSYFGKGSCNRWAKAIVNGIIETLEERGIDYLLPHLGLKINMSSGFGGTIIASFREALTNAANNSGFISQIEKSINNKICGFNIGDILSGNIISADKQKMLDQLENAEKKDPNIFAKAMKTGLSDVLMSKKN